MSGRSVCLLAVALVGAAVAWKGHPRSGPVEGGQMLFGTLVNRSHKPLRLRAADVRVLDGNGHALPAAAAFSSGYDASIALRGFGSEMFASAVVGAASGADAVVTPGDTLPLSVSWKGRAVAVRVAGSALPLH